MKNAKYLINDLNWNKPQKIQDNAIEKLIDIDEKELYLLVRPSKDKSCWENAAKVLEKIGYPKNKSILAELLIWLQDMNWPGAVIVFDILIAANKEDLIPYIENALKKANEERDYIWITSLKELINRKNISITDFCNEDIYKLIDLAEW